MRKIVYFSLCAAVICAALPMSACAEEPPRDRYEIVAEYFPEERLLEAEMRVTICNRTQTAWDAVKFQLYANAYREGAAYPPVSQLFAPAAYYDGASYGEIRVLAVDGAAGHRVCGEDENILEVSLHEPLYPDEQAVFEMRFEVTLAKIAHRLGVGEYTVNLANFYPVLCAYDDGFRECVYSYNGDPFVSECADYTVELTIPEDYDAAYTGTGECTRSGDGTLCRVAAENVRDVAFFLGDFQTVRAEACGAEVTYFYFDDSEPQTTLAAACESLAYFSGLFGEYAYPKYTLVQADFPYGGMEYPMLSVISPDVRADETAYVVAHETAHQWWYASVGSDQYSEAWQDEGLAEFSAALFADAHPAYGTTYGQAVAAAERAYRTYFSVQSQLSDADTSMRRPLTAYAGDYEYRSIAYDKGLILFDRLRQTLGDKKMFSALKTYARKYTGAIAAAEDLIACFSARSAQAEGIFSSFLDGLCVI